MTPKIDNGIRLQILDILVKSNNFNDASYKIEELFTKQISSLVDRPHLHKPDVANSEDVKKYGNPPKDEWPKPNTRDDEPEPQKENSAIILLICILFLNMTLIVKFKVDSVILASIELALYFLWYVVKRIWK